MPSLPPEADGVAVRLYDQLKGDASVVLWERACKTRMTEVTCDKLPPRLVRVEAEAERRGEVICRSVATIALKAGERASVALEFEDCNGEATVPGVVDIRGLLLVPQEISEAQREVELVSERTEELRVQRRYRAPLQRGAAEGAMGYAVYQWHVDQIVPGEYRVEVVPYGFCRLLRISPSSNQSFEILLPCRAHVRATFRDRLSGALLQPSEVLWAGVIAEGRELGSPKLVDHPNTKGEYVFDAPASLITVNPILRGYESVPIVSSVQLLEGDNELVMWMACTCQLEVVLVDSTLPVHRFLDWWQLVQYQRVDGSEARGSVWISGNGPKWVFAIAPPGAYRVVFPAIAGFRTPDAMTIDLESDRPTSTIVRLVRE
jgi:hypothetical protein